LVVPEELALEQPLGDRGAVDDDEGLLAARAPAVDGVGEALFARAGLAEDEDRRAGDRDLARFDRQLADGRGCALLEDARFLSFDVLLEQARVLAVLGRDARQRGGLRGVLESERE